MTYLEPQPSLKKLVLADDAVSSTVTFRSESGPDLEVARIIDTSWVIEVRYDRCSDKLSQQAHTSVQDSLEKVNILATDNGSHYEIIDGNELLRISKDTGAFDIERDSVRALASCENPFSWHSERVEIMEGLTSLKVTDWNKGTPFRSSPGKYSSHMVRFQYGRPQGLVLGIAGQAGEMNRNGYRFELFNNDEAKHIPSRRPLYQSWPIVFHPTACGSQWVCVFHDNPSRTFVDVGDFYPDKLTFESVTNNSRVYILVADSLREVSAKLCALLGPIPMPPLYGFGYQQCRFSYMNSDEIRQVAGRLHEENFPLDVMHFDIDYMDGYRAFTYNPDTFGDIEACVKELSDKNVKSICIIDPTVKVEQDYPLYKQLLETGAYWKEKSGEPFEAISWVGNGLVPDYADQKATELWSDTQKEWLNKISFSGVWNDMNEPSNFDGFNERNTEAFTVRGSHESEFNTYGYYMARASRLGWQKAHPNKRALIITRSGYPGVQRYATIWHGDNSCWWEHLQMAIDFTIAFSISGAFYTGPDLPGFFENPSDDLAVRAFQLGVFFPFYRGHSFALCKDKEPYAYGEKAKAIIRKAIHLRYSLLREWYSGFELAVRENKTPITPVLTSDNTLVRDQMLLFDKFLAAPVIERDQCQKLLYLPEGDWYQLGAPERILKGDSWINLSVDLETIPTYVRAGSIVVRNTVGLTTVDTLENDEEYTVYPDKHGNATGYWYSDDGVSIVENNRQHMMLKFDKETKKVLKEVVEV